MHAFNPLPVIFVPGPVDDQKSFAVFLHVPYTDFNNKVTQDCPLVE